MSYRFVKISSFYTSFLQNYYNENPAITTKSYNEQYAHLMEQGHGWANFFQLHLNALGVDAYELVLNAEYMQQAWASEYGSSKTGIALVLEQLKHLKPDVVYFQDTASFPSQYIKTLKSHVPSVKLVLGISCNPVTHENILNYKNYDLMIACSEQFSAMFNTLGIKSFEIHHGFEHTLLDRLQPIENKINDVVFIGNFIPTSSFHDDRLQVVEYMLKQNIPITILSKLQIESIAKVVSKQIGYTLAKSLTTLGLTNLAYQLPLIKKVVLLNQFPKRAIYSKQLIDIVNATSVFGIDMLNILAQHQIGFNIHGGIAGDYAANVRMYEVTGVGSCLVSDYKKNMHLFFEPDTEVVMYKSKEECVEKINWLLQHPAEAAKIAKAGQMRTLHSHSLQARITKLHEIIINTLHA